MTTSWPHNGADAVYRDLEAGVDYEPDKAEIRNLLGTYEDAINLLESGQSSGSVITATWSDLSSITGTAAGQKAEVIASATGTHTDPVVGGSVSNAGVYSWSTSPAGWERIGDNLSSTLMDRTESAGIIELSVSGSGNSWTGTVPSEYSGYSVTIGNIVVIRAVAANTGAVTLTIDGVSHEIVTQTGASLSGGELKSGYRYVARMGGSSPYDFYLMTCGDIVDTDQLEWQTRLSRWMIGHPNRKNSDATSPSVITFEQEGTGGASTMYVGWSTLRGYMGATSFQRIADLDVTELENDQCLYIDTTQTYTTEWVLSTGSLAALEQSFVTGDNILLIGNYVGIPVGELVPHIINADLQKSADAADDRATVKMFYSGSDSDPEYVEIDANGFALTEVDQYGSHTINSRSVTHSRFLHDARSTFPLETSESGDTLLEVDEHGGVSSPASRLFPIPYISGTELRAGEKGELVGYLRSDTVLQSVVQNLSSVRALTTRPGLYSRTSLSGSVGEGILVPDNNTVLHINIINGQSLSVGANASSSLVNTYSQWPDDTLMFDGDSTIDIRMGLPTLGGELQTLDVSTLTGFQSLIAKAGQGSGSRGETVAESIARHLSGRSRGIGIQHRTLWIAPGLGGTAYSGLQQGTTPYNNMIAAVTRAKELAEALGWKVVVDSQIILHGEGDASNSTYYDDLIEWQADSNTDIKAVTGQQSDIPFLMLQPSSFYGSGSGTEAVKAMLKAHELSSNHFLLSPHYPALDLYHTDILHFTGPGYCVLGQTSAYAVEQILWGDGDWDCVRITAASRTGTTVSLTYNVPEGPLLLDTETITERNTSGFEYFDDGGEIAISSVSVTDVGNDGTGTIELTLASTPSGTGETVNYAMDGHSGSRNLSTVPRGNVRDSAGDDHKSYHDGRRLDNWGIHQIKEVTVQ